MYLCIVKRLSNILIYTLILCIAVSCVGSKLDNSSDFTEVVYTPRYASGFEIRADRAGNTLLCVTRPWQGDAISEQRLARFADGDMAKAYNGEYIVGPAARVVCMSSSHVAMLDAIGRVEDVVGVSGKQYILNEKIAQNPSVADIGYDSNLDYEELLLLDADVVLMYGVSSENSSVTAKLRELGIPYIYLGDYVEQSPLGKAEWVVAVAEIMGCREQGEDIFRNIEERYINIRSKIPQAEHKPKVMFNLPYQDVWYMPSDESYMVTLVEDAGGSYIYSGKNRSLGSVGISLEEAYMLVCEADVWLNVGQCTSLDELRSSAPHFADAEVVRRGEVYNNNRRRTASGGSDFWESAIVCPDVVLEDLSAIMRGDTTPLYYHHRLR